MFDNRVEAWDLGPVIPEIYRKYKVCGKNPIASEEDNLNLSSLSEEECDVLFDVMREFGQYTGSKLVSFTHQPGTPWSQTKEAGKRLIDQAMIRDYFIKNPVEGLGEKLTKPLVESLPSDWYDPEEDAEWEAYL